MTPTPPSPSPFTLTPTLHPHPRPHPSPSPRQFYNLYLTAVSSLVAIGVGGVEVVGFAQDLHDLAPSTTFHSDELGPSHSSQVLGCVQDLYDLQGPFWSVITTINDNFEYVGYSIIAFFALSALGALLTLRCGRPKAGPIQIRPKTSPTFERSGSAELLKREPTPVWWGTRHWGKPEWPWRS